MVAGQIGYYRNQIWEKVHVLLAFKMSENCHFQIKWLDNPEYKKMVGYGK
jgi:hypothetical protein